MMTKFEKIIKTKYPIIFVIIVGLILIIFPFVTRNNLEGFDTAGQFSSIYYIRNFFWPWPSGWNSMFLGGFPQGLIYTPFFHWLGATLSFVLPIKAAYKLLLSSAIIMFPIFYYLLSKKLINNSLAAGAATVFVCIFYYFDLGLNDNLFSDLYFGMAPHLFSLTLFFGYLYFLSKIIEKQKHWYLAGLLLSMCITTHVFTGMAAVVFGIIFLGINYKNEEMFKSIFKHLILGSLLSAWWWLPFIVNINYVSGSDIGSVVSPVLVLLMPIIFIINIVSYFNKNNENTFLKTVSIFSSFVLVFFLYGRMFPVNGFPMHFSRFLVYSLFLTPILIVFILSKWEINWQKLNVVFLFIFGFYFFFFKITPVGPFDTYLIDNIKQYYQQGRVIVTGGSRYLDDRFHITRTKLAMEANIPTSEGLFVESSANGWFVMSLMKSWESTVPTFVWGYMNLKDVADIKWGTQIFGVNYEYRINDLKPSSEEKELLKLKTKMDETKETTEKMIYSTEKKSDFTRKIEDGEKNKEISLRKEKRSIDFKVNREKLVDDERIMSIFPEEQTPFYYQSFYKINDSSIAKALRLRPIDITNNWQEQTRRWWSTDWLASTSTKDYTKPVLIYRKNTKDWKLPENNINLTYTEASKKMDEFTVDASVLKSNAPIYVKVGYFPFWHAFDENGKEIEIYRASPNFMIVYGKGLITFKYINPWYYYFSFIISGLALLYIIFMSGYRLVKNRTR